MVKRSLLMASAVLAVGSCVAAKPLDVLVPVNWMAETYESRINELRNMHDRYGLSRFVLIGPWNREHCGRTTLADWEELGDSIGRAKRDLSGLGIEIGWWVVPTISGGKYRPFQCIMDCDGNKAYATCPLDPGFIKDFSDKVAACARRARPSVIFFEDDYTLSNHGGQNAMKGCFCPLHLAEYAKRTGKAYTAAEIAGMFRNPTRENAALRRQFAMLSRDSLAGLAKSIRAAIDSVDPSIRVCLCQSGFSDIDGDATEAVARAFAGNTRPMVRIFGAAYFNENVPMAIPRELAHTFWSAQHLGRDIELIHETDPCPHNRFFNSSLFLISELSGALMAGATGSYYYCGQYADNPMEDDGYALRLMEFRSRLETVRDMRARMRPCGVRAVYNPAEVYMLRETEKSAACGMLPVHAYFLAKMGFPMTTVEDSPVAMLIGNSPVTLSDDELRKLLAGGLFVDAEAAVILSARGFSGLMGCRAEKAGAKYLFNHERILPAAGTSLKGVKLYNRRMESMPYLGWTPKKESVLAELKPEPGAEMWSALYDIDGQLVGPATLLFKNALGGRVAVISRSLDSKSNPSIYSPRKQAMMHNLFARLAGDGAIDVTAPNTPSTWLAAARSEKELLVMAENLCGEPRSDFMLKFAPEWRGGRVCALQPDGSWRALGEATDAFAVPAGMLQPLEPCFFKVER